MSVGHKVKMKKPIYCHENWLTIHQPQKAVSYHMAITHYNPLTFMIGYPLPTYSMLP